VQAASIMGRLTPEGFLKFAATEINKYNEAAKLGKKIPNLTGEQGNKIITESKRIEQMPDGVEKAMAFKELNDYISSLIPSPWWKKVIAVWKAGLLTGVKTSGLNTLSNLSHGVSETIKDVPAVAIDNVTSLFTKRRTIGLTTRGLGSGSLEGFKKGWRYVKTGFDERDIATKLDFKKINFGNNKFAKGIQKYEETVFHILGAEDQPFFYGAKARSISSQAIAEAKNAKLKGTEAKKFIDNLIQNPTDEILKNAVSDAEMAVFQNPTLLAKVAKSLQNIPGGELIVPFGRTPSAVAMQLFNYSPLGVAKTIAQNIGKGKFNQKLFSQGMGRALTGSGIMAIGAYLFKKGMITTNYPTGERERELWKAEGRTPNSIKINGKYRNVNVFGPAGMALLVGAEYQKSLQKEGSPFKALTQAIASSGKSLTEQTFLQGIKQIVDSLNEPNRFSSYFSSTVSSIIPTIISDIAKVTDLKQRRTAGVLDSLKSRVPGVRQTLEPAIDVLGRERPLGGNILETLFDPSRPSKNLDNNVTLELRRLTNSGQLVSPTLLGDKNGYQGLTPKENTALWHKAGELTNSKLESLIRLPEYQNLDDEQKGKIVEKIIDLSKTYARVQTVMELTEGLQGQELKAKLSELKKSGLMNNEVFKKYMELY
jgi:hypothetical protein